MPFQVNQLVSEPDKVLSTTKSNDLKGKMGKRFAAAMPFAIKAVILQV